MLIAIAAVVAAGLMLAAPRITLVRGAVGPEAQAEIDERLRRYCRR